MPAHLSASSASYLSKPSLTVDQLHPYLRSVLATEHVIWLGRPEPRRLDREKLALGTLFTAIGVWLLGVLVLPPYPRQDVMLGFFLVVWFGFLFLIGGRMITQPMHEIYVLTDRCIMLTDPRAPATGVTFSADGGRGWKIRHIRITGSRANGGIEFRTIMSAAGSPCPWRMRSVPQPFEIAELIKTTLKLDLPIEDRTR